MRSGGDRQGVQQRDVGGDVIERETPRGRIGGVGGCPSYS